MKSYKKKIELDRRFIVIFISAGIWALLAHGMALFNKYSFHDDIGALNSVGNTYSLGRWMLGILDRIVKFITGSDHYSLPLTNGIITILCIGIVVYIISDKLKIESLILNILLCGVFISFPTITGIFGYMFTAPYYYFGTLLGVLGAYLFDKNRNIVTALFCTTLMACSAGVYQANIPICICTLLLFMIVNMSEFSSEWKLFWKETCINIGICIGFIVEYFVINKVLLHITGESLSDYKGINSFGKTGIVGYIKRICRAYKEFLLPTQGVSGNMYPFSAKKIYVLFVILMIIVVIIGLVKVFRVNN